MSFYWHPMVDPHTWKCQTGSWKPPWSYTHTPCRTHIFLTHFPCVAKGVCSAPHLSISPSPLSCFIRLFCCSRTVTSRPHSCLHSLCRTVPDPKARVKHTSARAAGSLATWPIPRTPQVVSPKSSTRFLLQTETRRLSTIRTTTTPLTFRKSRARTLDCSGFQQC